MADFFLVQRAQELMAVGQTQAALTILHEHVTSKRTRNNTIASLEPVMLLFVELCVGLRKGKLAKDGLYQYKNIAQNTNVGTIEVCSTDSILAFTSFGLANRSGGISWCSRSSSS
jgi:hypothetical protein